jgi:hypothetical protein
MSQHQLTIDPHWTYHGFRAVVLENRHLRAVILPELGAKVWSLVDKAADRELLWHNPRIPPRPVHYGAAYDDWFCGGWDELFPNDAPTNVAGEPYPDHGELWAMPFRWDLATSDGAVTLRMERSGVVTNTTVTKQITLRAAESLLRFTHQITNHGPTPLDYLWKLHPALNITPAARIDLPAQRIIVDPGFRDRLAVDSFTWPYAPTATGERIDVREVPPATAATCDFYYGVDLHAGWCALTDTASQSGFGLIFDPEVFRSVWVFGAYGGWRGLYTAILEPCTGYPYRLEDALAQGTASRLEAGTTLATEVTAVLYRGVQAVNQISPHGEVA